MYFLHKTRHVCRVLFTWNFMFTSENWKQQKCLSIRDRSSTLQGFSNMKHDATLDLRLQKNAYYYGNMMTHFKQKDQVTKQGLCDFSSGMGHDAGIWTSNRHSKLI